LGDIVNAMYVSLIALHPGMFPTHTIETALLVSMGIALGSMCRRNFDDMLDLRENLVDVNVAYVFVRGTAVFFATPAAHIFFERLL